MKRILIAVDNDPMSESVAFAGFDLAKKLHAEIGLLSVVDNSNLMTTGAVTLQELALKIENEVRKNLQLLVKKVFREHQTSTFVKKEYLSNAILETADQWQADPIVFSRYRKRGI